MKKFLAMTGTAALGTMGLLVTAAPAHAAPAEPPCHVQGDHQLDPTATPDSDWYMACIPQYGNSYKAEAQFTFTSADGFPAGFDPNDATIVTDFDDAAASAYTGQTFTNGFSGGFTAVSGTQTEQTYEVTTNFKIAGVSKVDPSALPADCLGTYNAAYRVDYVPRTITFSQTIDGKTYVFQNTVGSDPMLIGLNLTDSGGALVANAPACGAVGSAVSYRADPGDVLPPFASDVLPTDVSPAADIGPVVRLHTLAFDSRGGSAVTSEQVQEGSAATTPTPPTRPGYTFAGWFTQPTGGTQWNFDSPIQADATLYAHWTAASYTVTFDSQQGSAVDSATVASGSPVTKPANPTRANYTFDGWYTDPTGGQLWDFAAPIEANTTLYAHWSGPELAESGSDVAAWPLAGLGMLLAGAAAMVLPFTRRRRGEH